LDVADLSQFDGFRDALARTLEAIWRRKDFDLLINNAGMESQWTTARPYDERTRKRSLAVKIFITMILRRESRGNVRAPLMQE